MPATWRPRPTDARWLLFLNPDTEVLEGSLMELAAGLTAETGIAGVRQLDDSGALIPTMRLFPSASRALGDSLGLERFPRRPDWLGERELRLERYDREFEGDWTIGSFLLIRREAFDAVGGFDERFFLYSEEVDLCLRVQQAGWKVVHSPAVTILHHGNSDRPADARLQTQLAWARLQYADKNLPAVSRPVFRGALLLRYGLRALHGETRRRGAARAATALLLGRRPPPFESRRPAPPPVEQLAPGLEPGVIGATGGSGTRVLAAIAQRGGMFVGSDLNRSLDALDFAAFFDRWAGRELAPEAAAELRALVARQHAEAEGRPWGWKEPRSVYLLPFLAAELPGLRFLHVVRDGRDMALSVESGAAAQARRRGARTRRRARATALDRALARDQPAGGRLRRARARRPLPAHPLRGPLRASRQPAWRRCCASSGSTATPSGSPPTRCRLRRRSAAGARPTPSCERR